jgi:hypothetical protein
VTTFNQEGQTVHGPLTNIAGNVGLVNVGAVSDQAGLVEELERLKAELASSARRGEIDQDLATDADYQVTKARNEAAKPSPDRGRFLGYLVQARELLKTAAAGAGLVTALDKTAEIAQHLL